MTRAAAPAAAHDHRGAASAARSCDRGGRVLAYSVDADSVFADPTEIEEPDDGRRPRSAARSTSATPPIGRRWPRSCAAPASSPISQRKVSPDEEQRIRDFKLKGVGFLKESRRYYPNKELAAHVLGYVGLDNAGLGGLESAYDTPGARRAKASCSFRPTRGSSASTARSSGRRPPAPTLELTIDQYLQFVAERELRAGVEENRAAGGSAVIMDPQHRRDPGAGELPDLQPEHVRASPRTTSARNRAVQDLYEPGSTFKIVTASAALEEHVHQAGRSDRLQPRPDHVRQPRVIRDTHNYGTLAFTDVLVKSSNVGAIKVGMRSAPERLEPLRQPLRLRAGACAPDFRGENAGIVWNPDRLDPSALASVSMGYQVGVTAVQMAAAVSSVANGGTLYEPRVVRAVTKDGKRVEVAHKALRRTISENTAAQLTTIMEQVVERGTGKAAQIDGLHHRRQDRHGAEARRPALLALRLQRLLRRLPAVAQAGADDHRRHRLAARQGLLRRHGRGADLQAHRRGVAAPPRHRADDQPGAAGAGRAQRRRRDAGAARSARRRRRTTRRSSWPRCADGRRHARPARPERTRSAAQADQARDDGADDRATASCSSSRPPPAAPLGEADACVLTLGRHAVQAVGEGSRSDARRLLRAVVEPSAVHRRARARRGRRGSGRQPRCSAIAYDSRSGHARGGVRGAAGCRTPTGAAFARDAAARGAALVVVRYARRPPASRRLAAGRATPASRSASLAAAFYGDPSHALTLVGHHRDQRQDDDHLSARVHLRGGRSQVRAHRYYRIHASAIMRPRPREPRPRRRTCSGCCARW